MLQSEKRMISLFPMESRSGMESVFNTGIQIGPQHAQYGGINKPGNLWFNHL